MAPSTQNAIHQEAQLFARFADSYHWRLLSLIDQNRSGRLSNETAISMCVEAMGMLVDSHARLAHLLSKTGSAFDSARRAA
jgi:hypothetical protein